MSVLHHPWHVILVQLIGDIIGSKIKAPSRIKLTSLAFEQRRTCHQLTRVREVSTSAVLLESCARPPVLPSSSTQQIDAAVLKLFMQPQQRLVLPDKCFGLHRESQERRKFRKKNEQGTACSCRTLKQVKAPTKLRAVSNAEHVLLLPHTWPEDYTRIPRIIPATLLAVLQGSHRSIYDSTRLIDCRFEYEYYGGHIRSAEKNSGLEDCVDQLFVSGEPRKSRTLIVLYCEYSMYRAPLMYVSHTIYHWADPLNLVALERSASETARRTKRTTRILRIRNYMSSKGGTIRSMQHIEWIARPRNTSVWMTADFKPSANRGSTSCEARTNLLAER